MAAAQNQPARYELQTFGPLDPDEMAWSTLYFMSREKAHETFMRLATERGVNGIGLKLMRGNVVIAKFVQVAGNE